MIIKGGNSKKVKFTSTGLRQAQPISSVQRQIPNRENSKGTNSKFQISNLPIGRQVPNPWPKMSFRRKACTDEGSEESRLRNSINRDTSCVGVTTLFQIPKGKIPNSKGANSKFSDVIPQSAVRQHLGFGISKFGICFTCIWNLEFNYLEFGMAYSLNKNCTVSGVCCTSIVERLPLCMFNASCV